VCGIAGFVQRTAPGAMLGPMLARIARRGPDGQGEWTTSDRGGWNVALGHRRLAILDLEGGVQPMLSAGGTQRAITYNGELYNFRELRKALEGRGVSFRTHNSDTEVLLEHVAAGWTKALPDLDGMFAFALWDEARRTLLLARDRAGIKPLYYAPLPGGGLAFASELTAILAHPDLASRKRLSAAGLQSYFFSDYFHPPHTLIEGVHQLPPGHFLEWSDGRLGPARPYWTLQAGDGRPHGTDEDLARELWSMLAGAVERQLVSDVPIGVFLSGGLDSSCVATLAQQASRLRLKTFSIGFEDPSFDESAHARAVASRIGSEHVEQRVTEHGLLELLDEALGRLDQPLADPSYIPTFLLSSLAAQHVKVVLGGDGGDELFAGYATYRAQRYARFLAPLASRLATDGGLGPIGRASHRWLDELREQDGYQTLEWKLKRFFVRWDDDLLRRQFRWLSSLDLGDLRRAIPASNGAIPATLACDYPAYGAFLAKGDAMNAILALDFSAYLPGSILTKADRASMAHGLEVRPPLLDSALVDWAFSLPSSLKLRRGQTKYLLKRAAATHLPEAIVHRPKKGFGIPLGAWLRGPLRSRLARALEPSALWDSGLLDHGAFAEWTRKLDERRGDYSKGLWALVVLDDWVRREGIA
jgi:asparagine synthase (glutamine-hydrolysing)